MDNHEDWCTPEVRRDVAETVSGSLPDGAALAIMEEFGVDPY